MGATLRARLTRERRKNLVLEYYLRGWTFSQITKELKVSRSTVSKDINSIRDEWRATRADAIGKELLHELARIDAIERETWTQWESSKVEEVTTRAETEVIITTDSSGRQVRTPGSEKVVRSTKLRNADPRYMDSIRWCIEQRCKLLGLVQNAAAISGKLALTGPDGVSEPKISLDLSKFSDEELEVLDKVRDRMMGLPDRGDMFPLN